MKFSIIIILLILPHLHYQIYLNINQPNAIENIVNEIKHILTSKQIPTNNISVTSILTKLSQLLSGDNELNNMYISNEAILGNTTILNGIQSETSNTVLLSTLSISNVFNLHDILSINQSKNEIILNPNSVIRIKGHSAFKYTLQDLQEVLTFMSFLKRKCNNDSNFMLCEFNRALLSK